MLNLYPLSSLQGSSYNVLAYFTRVLCYSTSILGIRSGLLVIGMYRTTLGQTQELRANSYYSRAVLWIAGG